MSNTTFGPSRMSGAGVDLSPRVFQSSAVAASPTDATETVVCTLTLSNVVDMALGVLLFGYGAYTQGTNGTGSTFKIRRTGTSGTTIKTSGIIPIAAAALGEHSICGVDTTAPAVGQVYVLTALQTAATAASTFSAVQLIAIVI